MVPSDHSSILFANSSNILCGTKDAFIHVHSNRNDKPMLGFGLLEIPYLSTMTIAVLSSTHYLARKKKSLKARDFGHKSLKIL